MSNIININPIVTCPLCHKQMKVFYTKLGKVYACLGTNCMICIDARDPSVNKWDMREPPVCIFCGHKMRAFFRMKDKFLKCQCHNCLTTRNKLVQVVRGEIKDIDPKWSVEVKNDDRIRNTN